VESPFTKFTKEQLIAFAEDGCTFGTIIMTGNEPIDVQRCDDCSVFQTDIEAAQYMNHLLDTLQAHLITRITDPASDAQATAIYGPGCNLCGHADDDPNPECIACFGNTTQQEK
jgi:hypothetical protein